MWKVLLTALLFLSPAAYAEQAVLFMQPSGSVPIPVPTDSTNAPKFYCTNCGGGGTAANTVITDPLTAANQMGVTAAGSGNVNLKEVAGVATKTGHGTAADALRVELPTDGTGVVGITGTVTVVPTPTVGTGCTPYHLSGGTAASTNSTNIKGSAGVVCVLSAINTTSTLYYLKVYNSASAPTCSSATDLTHVFPIPHNSGAGNGMIYPIALNEVYSTGIGFCVTGGGGDTDNTNAATGVYIEGSYK